jgi:hypothetical protein
MDWNRFNNAVSAAIVRAGRLDELFAELGCDLKAGRSGVAYRGRCPVHEGDGDNLILRADGDAVPVYWRCVSHHCEETYKPSLLGLVSGACCRPTRAGGPPCRRRCGSCGRSRVRSHPRRGRPAPGRLPLACSG